MIDPQFRIIIDDKTIISELKSYMKHLGIMHKSSSVGLGLKLYLRNSVVLNK